jgi:hypothetical protein
MSGASLIVTAVSSNAGLIPNDAAHLILASSINAERFLQVVPATGSTGFATITLTVTDGDGASASSSFTITVTAANQNPQIADLSGHRIVSPGSGIITIPFTISDAETEADALAVSAEADNPDLVPSIAITGSGAARSMQITPASDAEGVSVITVRIVDELGASCEGYCIVAVVDPHGVNVGIHQPVGLYVLDASSGSTIGGVAMRDGNITDRPFVDGYLLRTDWATLAPMEGVFDFTIIDNALDKLPVDQRLSLIILTNTSSPTSPIPAWLLNVPGIETWTAGSPAVTQPLPWNPVALDHFRALLRALAAHEHDGIALSGHPRLAALNANVAGLKSGIRNPDEIDIRDMPGYTRELMEEAVITHLIDVTEAFPATPVQVGFWTYLDDVGGIAPWEELRQAILATFDGSTRPRIGFWMENLAASRPVAGGLPIAGSPGTGFAAALHLSQDQAYNGFQMLGCWSRPFNVDHIDNNLNGSPEDAMAYAFDTFRCRYFEIYETDAVSDLYQEEFTRWQAFLADLPRSDAGIVGFVAAASSQVEGDDGDATIHLVVRRRDGSKGAVSVSCTVVGGSASTDVDFTAVSDTLTWADGDTSDRGIDVVVHGDVMVEGDETVLVMLSDPTGGIILGDGDEAAVSLTIVDDDSDVLIRSIAIDILDGNVWDISPDAGVRSDTTSTSRWTDLSPADTYTLGNSSGAIQ